MNKMFFKKCWQPLNVVFLLTAEFIFLDLTSLKSVRQFVQKFKDRGLPLHVLVNNGMLLSLTQQKHQNQIIIITDFFLICFSFASRSWNHAGSRDTNRGRIWVTLWPELPGPLLADQPAARHPEEFRPTGLLLQNHQHVLCYTLRRSYEDGQLKQEVWGAIKIPKLLNSQDTKILGSILSVESRKWQLNVPSRHHSDHIRVTNRSRQNPVHTENFPHPCLQDEL